VTIALNGFVSEISVWMDRQTDQLTTLIGVPPLNKRARNA